MPSFSLVLERNVRISPWVLYEVWCPQSTGIPLSGHSMCANSKEYAKRRILVELSILIQISLIFCLDNEQKSKVLPTVPAVPRT